MRDFAGGIVIHTTSGVAAFVVALVLQRRKGFKLRGAPRKHIKKLPLKGPLAAVGYFFRKEPEDTGRLAYHNLPLSYVGATIIWVGWYAPPLFLCSGSMVAHTSSIHRYSFNGGSALAANGQASKALMNTHIASCAAGMVWVLMTYLFVDRKYHLTELMSGIFAGLACITPGSGMDSVTNAPIIGCPLILSSLSERFRRSICRLLYWYRRRNRLMGKREDDQENDGYRRCAGCHVSSGCASSPQCPPLNCVL